MDYYELLNISRTASPREIKRHYRRLLSNESLSGEQFAVIEDAYATLSDDELRQAYDDQLATEESASQLPVPVAKSTELVDKPTAPASTFAGTDVDVSQPTVPRPRRRRRNANPVRTVISCVAAALAAGPVALFILKFVFEKDPLKLWSETSEEVTVRRPADARDVHAPGSRLSDTKQSNNEQRNRSSSTFQQGKPTNPNIPLPQSEDKSKADIQMPQTEVTGAVESNNPPKTTVTPERTSAQRMPVPTPNELAGPQSRLERLFIDDYKEAISIADHSARGVALVDLANTLFSKGKLVLVQNSDGSIVNEKRNERYAWYCAAFNISIESEDAAQLEAICHTLCSEFQIDDYTLNNKITHIQFQNVLMLSKGKSDQFLTTWKLLFQKSLTNSLLSIDAGNSSASAAQLDLAGMILEQFKPELYLNPNDRERLNNVLGELFGQCSSNSLQYERNRHFELSLHVLQIAKRIATIGRGKNEKLIVDKLIAQNARLLDLQSAYENAKLKYDKSPDDPKINGVIAIYSILIDDNWADGLFFLARSDDAILANIAKIDNQATAEAKARDAVVSLAKEMKLAEQWHDLYNPLDSDINRKEIILGRTKFWYEQTIPDLTPLQTLEIEKLMDELNNGLK
jgi:curved DNA-binding protein CbpA